MSHLKKCKRVTLVYRAEYQENKTQEMGFKPGLNH